MRVKSEARREAILDVAMEMFLNDGYSMTSMAKIAASTCGSKGTLYNYFSSKEDILSAIVSRRSQALGAQLFEIADINSDTRSVLQRLAKSYLNFVTAPFAVQMSRLVIAETARFPEVGRVFYENGPRVSIDRLASIFQRFMDAGQLKVADTTVAALHFKGLCDSSVIPLRFWGVTESEWPHDLDTVATLAVDAFLQGYANRPPGGKTDP